jgi:hypothetical protein
LKELGVEVSEEAMKFFGAAKSGILLPGDHVSDAAHNAYNKAVAAELKQWALTHDFAKMTTDEARVLVNRILSSSNPVLRGYIEHIALSATAKAAAILGSNAGSQLGRASIPVLRFIGGVGGMLAFHMEDAY